MELTKMYGELGISEKVLNYGREIEKSLHDRFEAIDKTAEYNQLKVIKAMQEARVSDIILPERPVTVTMTLAVTRWKKYTQKHFTVRMPLCGRS